MGGSGGNFFYGSILYGDGEKWIKEVKTICDRGIYNVLIEAAGSSSIWNQRFVHLIITIKQKFGYNKDSGFKEALTGMKTKWNTSRYTGKTVGELKTASFQENVLDFRLDMEYFR